MKKRITAGIAFAVCAAVVIAAFVGGIPGGKKKADTDGIRTFESYSEIEKVLNDIEEDQPLVYTDGGIIEEPQPLLGTDGSVAINEDQVAESAPLAQSGVAKSDDRSDTYIQVEGVDEADIIKTDGDYIYYTSRLGYDVIIAKVQDGKAEDAAMITEEETGVTADNLFLTDGRLVITGTEFNEPENNYGPAYDITTAACIYDVSDPEKPELIGKYKQSGSYVSSRVTGGYLYLISNDYLNTGERRIVPSAGAGDEYGKLEADHICCFPEPSRRSYIVTGAVKVDSRKGKIKSDTRAVLGASEDIYCNAGALYLTDFSVDYRDFKTESADERTQIIKADIGKGKIDFKEQGSVRGRVLNQFAMDEKDGCFRIATTAFVKGRDVNYLYVLDENLQTVGKVKGFAAGEEIKAVRYIGDTAYVITYEQTDPLFIIDLSTPEKPEMLGSVKITGFSSLLLPEGENLLIGIGSSTSEGEFGEVEDGIKIALFDISDPANPQVLDSMTYKDYSSDVQYDHRALTVNKKEGWYAIPYINWNDENGGVIQFRVSDNKLAEIACYEGEQGIDRCLYIGDYIYGLETDEDKIISWQTAH